MLDDAACPWCVVADETSTHALMHCRRVLDLCNDSGCKYLVENIGKSWCDLVVGWKGCDAKLRQKAVILAWSIWMERNTKVFDGKIGPNEVILSQVKRLAF